MHPVKAAVIGDPVEHSLSPQLHNFWLQAHQIPARYEKYPVSEKELKSFFTQLPHTGLYGINVTVPHKEKIIPYLEDMEEEAREIGAVNTVCVTAEKKLLGKNTDCYGFIAALKASHPKIELSGKAVTILGAGGAARAILYGLLKERVRAVICNRTREKARSLARSMAGPVHVVPWQERQRLLSETDILINTTVLGMHGQPAMELSLSTLKPQAIVCDIIYQPRYTPLLQQAQYYNHAIIEGIDMLIYQAVPAFKAWFGVTPAVTEAVKNHLYQYRNG